MIEWIGLNRKKPKRMNARRRIRTETAKFQAFTGILMKSGEDEAIHPPFSLTKKREADQGLPPRFAYS